MGSMRVARSRHSSAAGRPLYIPLDAVFEKEGKALVYLVKGGKAEAQEVKLGKKNEDYVIVEEGLGEDPHRAALDLHGLGIWF